MAKTFRPYDQDTLLAAFREHWSERHYNLDRLDRLHRNVLVGGRHLALPMEDYAALDTFGKANDAWVRVALEVGGEAVTRALQSAGLTSDDVDTLLCTSVTGIATPSIGARLAVVRKRARQRRSGCAASRGAVLVSLRPGA